MAAKQKQEEPPSRGKVKTEANRSFFGTAIPNVKDIRSYEAGQKKQEVYQAAINSGASEDQAKAQVAGSGYGSITPNLDRSAYEESQRQNRLAEETASAPPVKKDLQMQQLIRSFKGLAPLAETPEQFASQIETSKGFGEKSALLTPAGKSRATESAIAAGLSPNEAQSQIRAATESLLKDTRDKVRITQGLSEYPKFNYNAIPAPTTPATTAATVVPPVVKAPMKPTSGALPTTPTGTTADTDIPESFTELAKGAVGDLNLIGPAAATSRATLAAAKTITGVPDNSRWIGSGARGPERSLLGSAESMASNKSKDLMQAAMGKKVVGNQIEIAADLAKQAETAKDQATAAKAASNVAQGLATPSEAARDAAELKRLSSIKAGEDSALYANNARLAAERAAKAAAEAKQAEATLEGTGDLASKFGKLGEYAAQAEKYIAGSAKWSKAAALLKAISNSKAAGFLGGAGKVLQVADPAIQGLRYQNDEDFRNQQIQDTLDASEKGIPYYIARAVLKGTPMNPFANPVATFASMMEAPLESRNRILSAKGDLAATETKERLVKARQDREKEAQRSLISDADYKALPVNKKLGVNAEVANLLKEQAVKRKNAIPVTK